MKAHCFKYVLLSLRTVKLKYSVLINCRFLNSPATFLQTYVRFQCRLTCVFSLPQAAVKYGSDPRVFSIMSKVCQNYILYFNPYSRFLPVVRRMGEFSTKALNINLESGIFFKLVGSFVRYFALHPPLGSITNI